MEKNIHHPPLRPGMLLTVAQCEPIADDRPDSHLELIDDEGNRYLAIVDRWERSADGKLGDTIAALDVDIPALARAMRASK
jgi:hypothetical protein